MLRRGSRRERKDTGILTVLFDSFVRQRNLGVVATHKIFGARSTVPKTVNFLPMTSVKELLGQYQIHEPHPTCRAQLREK